jgi:hypothetical protein
MATVNFTRIDKLLDSIAQLDESKMWFFAVDEDVKDEIIRLNTEEQLEEQGIDSLGRDLGDYSPLTIMFKKMKGQRYDHITLKDTGEFYNSWVVRVTVNDITIDANDQKEDTALFEVYGVDVIGLTEENLVYIKEMILENYIKYLLNELL